MIADTCRETLFVRGLGADGTLLGRAPRQGIRAPMFGGDRMTSLSPPSRELASSQDLLTVEDLCRWLKVPKATVYDWTHTGVIPHYKVGRLVRFNPHEIEAWLEARKIRGRSTRIPGFASRAVSRLHPS